MSYKKRQALTLDEARAIINDILAGKTLTKIAKERALEYGWLTVQLRAFGFSPRVAKKIGTLRRRERLKGKPGPTSR